MVFAPPPLEVIPMHLYRTESASESVGGGGVNGAVMSQPKHSCPPKMVQKINNETDQFDNLRGRRSD